MRHGGDDDAGTIWTARLAQLVSSISPSNRLFVCLLEDLNIIIF